MPERLTEEQVRHVAKLARLRLSDGQIHRMAEQLSNVLGYVSKLNELNVDGVEPMAHAMDVVNVLRDDAPGTPLPIDDVLRNAPQREDPFFGVPKVIDDGGGA